MQSLLTQTLFAVAFSNTMAKLLFVVAVLSVASAFEAEAQAPPVVLSAPLAVAAPPPKPDAFSFKCVIHNLGDRCVSLGLEVGGKELE